MMKQNGAERRVLERRHLIYYLCVFNAETGSLLGHLADVTTKGLMLVSGKPIETGSTYECKLELPFDEADPFMTFMGEIRWCRKDANPSFHDTGILFPKLTLKNRGIIKTLIEEYGFMH